MARRVARRPDRSPPPAWWAALTGALGVGPRRPPRDDRAGVPRTRYAARTRSSSHRRATDRQAHPDGNYRAYVVGFGVIIVILVAFLYVGVSWATTGASRTAAMVPAAAPPPPAMPATDVPTVAPEPSPTAATTTYVVKAGDTPAAIARRYRIKVDDLLSANNITDPRALQVGQMLKIPGGHS